MLSKYNSIIFDCDGVILNSNNIKSNAFYETVKDFGVEFALQLYNYHIENGGISRYAKFEYFEKVILKNQFNVNRINLLEKFSAIIIDSLINCEIMEGIDSLRSANPNCHWSVISGGDELELNYIFQKKNIEHYFDNRIFGSPKNKYEIIEREKSSGNYQAHTLFIGDSKLDFEVAKYFNFDFVFVSQWTELKDWRLFCSENDIFHVNAPKDILTIK